MFLFSAKWAIENLDLQNPFSLNLKLFMLFIPKRFKSDNVKTLFIKYSKVFV